MAQPGLFSSPDSPRPPWPLARVVVERGIDRLDLGWDGLTYAVPPSLADLAPGERVEVPLGRNNRPAPGIVVQTGKDVPAPPAEVEVKPILRRQGGRLPPGLVDLARWMGRYYCCPLGVALAAMTPGAVKKEAGKVVRVLVEPTAPPPAEIPKLPPTARAAWEKILALQTGIFPLTAKELCGLLGLRGIGPLNRLIAAGLLSETRREQVKSGPADSWTVAAEPTPEPALTPEQSEAVERICGTLGTFKSHLLLGITGSGKTEVYLRVLRRVLDRGDSAIVLVPEISLTPQTASRFVARFKGAGVAVLHSGLSASRRNREWQRVASGEARVVIGARSAIFAPLPERTGRGRLGLIVVDEEHDNSYKQEQSPRYHGRDVALRRGQLSGCPVILGSATPSLESWHNASEGRYVLHGLPRRVGGGVLPAVEIVDLREEAASRQNEAHEHRRLHALGPRLEHALARTLDSGGQAILLLNRRGYANYIHCPDQHCGWIMNCAYCDVTMVFHAGRHRVSGGLPLCRCHHCQAEQKLRGSCPVCGKRVNTFGVGTQRLEEELARKFPSLVEGGTMLRLDADTMHRADDYFGALDRFGRGEVKLLLGTQMIAKGLDFPNVRLVGVVNADTALYLPDFRSSERTFQLVAQVAGRAGRASGGGRLSGERDRVIVQTYNPRDPSIVAAAAHDYAGFARRELESRKAAGLPPAWRMARIVSRDEDPAEADKAGKAVAEAIHEFASARFGNTRDGLRVRGPFACPISRIGGYFRVSVEVLAPTAGIIQEALTYARNRHALHSDERTAVDVDPQALL